MHPELARNISASKAQNTRRAYASAWRAFCEWSGEPLGVTLPAHPGRVAEYLSEVGRSKSHATVRSHAAAIANAHREQGLESPTKHPMVREALSGHANRRGVAAEQAAAIDAEAWGAIRASAFKPRVTRGGRMESEAEAERRGLLDLSLIGLMRDALLRRGEAAALKWGHLVRQRDGSALVAVQRSKTDQKGEGALLWVSPDVTRLLTRFADTTQAGPADSMFGLAPYSICRRIAAACRQAGLEGHYSGHSPRVGMTQDLARGGASVPRIQMAGRWRRAEMVGVYIRGIEAGDGAVAEWYAGRSD